MKLVVSIAAQRDRDNTYDFIAARDTAAAERVDVAIQRDLDFIARRMVAGHVAAGDSREFVVRGTPYIISFAYRGDTIRVLRIWHHAQNRPTRKR